MSCTNCKGAPADFYACEPSCVNASHPGIARCDKCGRRDCGHDTPSRRTDPRDAAVTELRAALKIIAGLGCHDEHLTGRHAAERCPNCVARDVLART